MKDAIQRYAAKWLPADSAVGRLGRGAFWLSSGAGVTHAMGMVSAIVAARLLGAEEFGQLSVLRSSVDMMALFAGLALGATANRYVAAHRSSEPEKAGRVIGMTTTIAWGSAGAAALLLCLLAEVVARTLHAPSLVFEIRLAAAMLFFATVGGAYSGILGGFEAFKVQGRISAITAATMFPMVIGGVMLAGVAGGVLALGVASALSLTLSVRAVGRLTRQSRIEPRFCWSREQRQVLREFTAPALLSGLLVTPVFWLGNVILVSAPGGYEQMGLFAAANQWRNVVVVIPGILGAVSLPILSNLHGSGNRASYLKTLKASLGVTAGVTLALAAPLALLSPKILGLYGAEFQSGSMAMMWLLAAGVFFALANVVGQLIASAGRMWIGFGLNLCWAGVFLAGAWSWCPIYGAAGLAGAYALSYAIHACVSALVGWRLVAAGQRASSELRGAVAEAAGA